MGDGKIESHHSAKKAKMPAPSAPASIPISQKGQASESKAVMPKGGKGKEHTEVFTEIDLGPPALTIDNDDDMLDASWHLVSTDDYLKK